MTSLASMPAPALEQAARFIADLRLRHAGVAPPVERLPDGSAPATLDEGYAIQAVASRLIAEGLGEPVGWKVGATSPVMQDRLGIPFPCAGRLYRGGLHQRHASLDRRHYASLKLECEIGVRLARDLPGRTGGHTRDSVREAVGGAMASIEIVENRWTDFAAVGPPTLVADDFFSCGAIFGEERPVSAIEDAGQIGGRIIVNGAVAFSGKASDILGHPLNSLVWLADHCAAQGTPLRAGELITLGSISPGIAVPDAGLAEVFFDGLPPVTAEIL